MNTLVSIESDESEEEERLYCSAPQAEEDIIWAGSDTEQTPEEVERKHLRYEEHAQRYLRGKLSVLLSAGLKGPFEKGWVNPWRYRRRKVPDWWQPGSKNMMFTRANVLKRAADHGMGHLRPAEALAWCKAEAEAEAAAALVELEIDDMDFHIPHDHFEAEQAHAEEGEDEDGCRPQADTRNSAPSGINPPQTHTQPQQPSTEVGAISDVERMSDWITSQKTNIKRPADVDWLKGSYVSKKAKWDSPAALSPTPISDPRMGRERKQQPNPTQSNLRRELPSSYLTAPWSHEAQHREQHCASSNDKPRVNSFSSASLTLPISNIDRLPPISLAPKSAQTSGEALLLNRRGNFWGTVLGVEDDLPNKQSSLHNPRVLTTEPHIISTPAAARTGTQKSVFDSGHLPTLPRTTPHQTSHIIEDMDEVSFITEIAPSSRNLEHFQYRKKRRSDRHESPHYSEEETLEAPDLKLRSLQQAADQELSLIDVVELVDTQRAQDPQGTEDIRGHQDPEGLRGYQELQKAPEAQEVQGLQEAQDVQEPEEPVEYQEYQELQELQEDQGVQEVQEVQVGQEPKEPGESREYQELQELQEPEAAQIASGARDASIDAGSISQYISQHSSDGLNTFEHFHPGHAVSSNNEPSPVPSPSVVSASGSEHSSIPGASIAHQPSQLSGSYIDDDTIVVDVSGRLRRTTSDSWDMIDDASDISIPLTSMPNIYYSSTSSQSVLVADENSSFDEAAPVIRRTSQSSLKASGTLPPQRPVGQATSRNVSSSFSSQMALRLSNNDSTQSLDSVGLNAASGATLAPNKGRSGRNPSKGTATLEPHTANASTNAVRSSSRRRMPNKWKSHITNIAAQDLSTQSLPDSSEGKQQTVSQDHLGTFNKTPKKTPGKTHRNSSNKTPKKSPGEIPKEIPRESSGKSPRKTPRGTDGRISKAHGHASFGSSTQDLEEGYQDEAGSGMSVERETNNPQISQVVAHGLQSPWAAVDTAPILPWKQSNINENEPVDAREVQGEVSFRPEQSSNDDFSKSQQLRRSSTPEYTIRPFKDFQTPTPSPNYSRATQPRIYQGGLPSAQVLVEATTGNPWTSNLKKPKSGKSKKRVSFGGFLSQEDDTQSQTIRTTGKGPVSPPMIHTVTQLCEEDVFNGGTTEVNKFGNHFSSVSGIKRIPAGNEERLSLQTSSPTTGAMAEAFITADHHTGLVVDTREVSPITPPRRLNQISTKSTMDGFALVSLSPTVSFSGYRRTTGQGSPSKTIDYNMDDPLDDFLGEAGGILEEWSVDAELRKATRSPRRSNRSPEQRRALSSSLTSGW